MNNLKPSLIVIAGRKRAGKDTIAGILKEVSTSKMIQVALASPMKKLLADLLQVPQGIVEHLKEREGKPVTPYGDATGRTMLQTLGQEIKTLADDQLFWCRVLARDIDLTKCHHVISDIRFPFEEAFFRKLAEASGVHYLSIKVERDDVDKDFTHESEAFIDDIKCDITIKNNGSIEELHSTLIEAVSEFYVVEEG